MGGLWCGGGIVQNAFPKLCLWDRFAVNSIFRELKVLQRIERLCLITFSKLDKIFKIQKLSNLTKFLKFEKILKNAKWVCMYIPMLLNVSGALLQQRYGGVAEEIYKVCLSERDCKTR